MRDSPFKSYLHTRKCEDRLGINACTVFIMPRYVGKSEDLVGVNMMKAVLYGIRLLNHTTIPVSVRTVWA